MVYRTIKLEILAHEDAVEELQAELYRALRRAEENCIPYLRIALWSEATPVDGNAWDRVRPRLPVGVENNSRG